MVYSALRPALPAPLDPLLSSSGIKMRLSQEISRLWSGVPNQFTGYVRPADPVDESKESTLQPTADGTNPAVKIPAAVPKVAQVQASPPPANGAEILPRQGRSGFGELRIVNRTEQDALAKLAEKSAPRRILRSVYVRAGDRVAIREIGLGSYLVTVDLGSGWNAAARTFIHGRSQAGPIGPLDFPEFQSSKGTTSVDYEVVLRPGK